MNRLTITLPDDLYAMARAKAISSKTSISKAIGELMRRAVSPSVRAENAVSQAGTSFHIDPITLLPVVQSDGRKFTMEDVQRAMDDDDIRMIEAAGWMNPRDPSS